MNTAADTELPAGQAIKPKLGTDDWIMRGFIAMIAVYLVVALALPLYAMLSKSFATYQFDLNQYEFQLSDENGVFSGESFSAKLLNSKTETYSPSELSVGANGRLELTAFFPIFHSAALCTTKFAALMRALYI